MRVWQSLVQRSSHYGNAITRDNSSNTVYIHRCVHYSVLGSIFKWIYLHPEPCILSWYVYCQSMTIALILKGESSNRDPFRRFFLESEASSVNQNTFMSCRVITRVTYKFYLWISVCIRSAKVRHFCRTHTKTPKLRKHLSTIKVMNTVDTIKVRCKTNQNTNIRNHHIKRV